MGELALQVRHSQEDGNDHSGDELQVVGVDAQQSNNCLYNQIVNDRADRNGEQLQTEVDENLAEDHFPDNDSSQTDNNSAAAHINIGKALLLCKKRAGKSDNSV